jgi:hypothetical protein
MPANPPYQRCSKLDKLDRIIYPAIVQKKCDGMFVNVIIVDGVCSFMTRVGEPFELACHSPLFEFYNGLVFHGEAIVAGKDRHTSNGLMNRLLQKGTVIESMFPTEDVRKDYDWIQQNTILHLWDVMPYEDWIAGECKVPYAERIEWLCTLQFDPDRVQIIESQIVESQEEAIAIAEDYIRQGYEGAVLKNMNAGWKNHTSPHQIKLKNVEECDLKVVDWIEGKGKNKGLLGSLQCESCDGMVQVDVGTGLSDEERTYTYEWVGSIIRVLYEKLTMAKNKDTWSLSHPRFDEVRQDKMVADDYETIKAKQKVSI